jgi:hypothetical protein
LDGAEQLEHRMRLRWGDAMRRELVAKLGAMLEAENVFVGIFKQASAPDVKDRYLCITGGAPAAVDRRRYNTPVVPEVAAFIPDEEAAVASTPRNIVVRVKGLEGGLKFISEYNAAYDPLHFVLLFPRGELGWTEDIPSSAQQRRRPGRAVVDTEVALQQVAKPAHGTVTLREYLAYYLMDREGQPNPLHRCGALFQEWTVIQWAKVEQQPTPFLAGVVIIYVLAGLVCLVCLVG